MMRFLCLFGLLFLSACLPHQPRLHLPGPEETRELHPLSAESFYYEPTIDPGPHDPFPYDPAKESYYIGKTTDYIQKEFGTPSVLREDPPFELWRYDTAYCRLFVMVKNSKTHRNAVHLDAYPTGTRKPDMTECIRFVREAARSGPRKKP